jgi:hypothetical protein
MNVWVIVGVFLGGNLKAVNCDREIPSESENWGSINFNSLLLAIIVVIDY